MLESYQVVMLYTGAGLTMMWGIAHLVPTRSVVAGFGDISDDNRRIITMEWITEGVALIFLGLLVGVVTFMDPVSEVASAIYMLSALCLFVLAIVSLFTGFRVGFLPYKLCPVIFSLSAVLVVAGGLI
jgi:hypothetical protein